MKVPRRKKVSVCKIRCNHHKDCYRQSYIGIKKDTPYTLKCIVRPRLYQSAFKKLRSILNENT